MRIQVLSDLHLETHPDYRPRAAPGADLLVLAGDIGSYQRGSRLAPPHFGLERFAPAWGAPWPRVLFLPGNHEYDGLDYDETRGRLRGVCERLGIDWLDRETLVIDGVRFVGTTLWADFDALAQEALARGDDDEVLRQRGKAFRAANHYLARHTTQRHGEPMLAEALRDLALDCQGWLREALARPHPGPTVVVTHFAPTLRSADPRYGLVPGTAGFCNALDELLVFADVWIHGHLHHRVDYVVEGRRAGRPWRCRVVANPMGYAHKGEQAGFDDRYTVQIDRSARGGSDGRAEGQRAGDQ